MKKYIFIGTGGFLGAILRYFIKGLVIFKYSGVLPINTMLINITGSFILAFFLTTAFEIIEINEEIRLGFAAGFLGAFTTFSTMCKETVVLLESGVYLVAFINITVSVILGMTFAFAAVILARGLVPKLKKHNNL